MKYFFLFFLFLPLTLNSQNIVHNGSLEDTVACPIGLGDIEFAEWWFKPSQGSSDYFNACSINAGLNVFGYQVPHSGQAYAGIIMGVTNYRELVEVALIDSLIAGNCYHLEYFISCGTGDNSTDDIYVLFSDTLIHNILTSQVASLNPQLSNIPGNYPDTASWLLIQGDYLAHGGEKYLMIGNFYPNPTLYPIATGSSFGPGPYFYIDDVSLVLTSCTGIEENPHSNFSVNYFENNISVFNSTNSKSSLTIFDINGNKLKSKEFVGNSEINISDLSNGIYFYVVSDGNSIKSGKLLKN